MVWLAAGTFLSASGQLQEGLAWAVYAVGAALIVLASAFQYTGRCPHCRALLGLQTRLTLPPTCRRCSGPLR